MSSVARICSQLSTLKIFSNTRRLSYKHLSTYIDWRSETQAYAVKSIWFDKPLSITFFGNISNQSTGYHIDTNFRHVTATSYISRQVKRFPFRPRRLTGDFQYLKNITKFILAYQRTYLAIFLSLNSHYWMIWCSQTSQDTIH